MDDVFDPCEKAPHGFCPADSGDVTVRMDRAELAQLVSELSEAQEIAKMGSFRFDVVEGTLTSSRQLDRIMGWPEAGERTLKAWRDLLHAEDRGTFERAFAKCLREGVAMDQEYRIIRRSDGRTRWLRAIVKAETDDGGRVTSVSGVNLDLTEKRVAEQAAHESEQRFLTMADAAPVLIWTADAQSRCTYFNRTWLEFTGRPLARELGEGWTEGVHPEDLTGCLEAFWGSFSARRAFHSEFRLRRRDGKYRWLLNNGVPRHFPDGGFAGYIGSCVDITERKESLQALQATAKTAAELHRCLVAINACPDVDAALACLLREALSLVQMDCGAIHLIEGPDVVLRHQRGLEPAYLEQVARWPFAHDHVATAFAGPLDLVNVFERFPEERQLAEPFGIRHQYCLALVAAGERIGLLTVGNRSARAPGITELELLRVLAMETESAFARLASQQHLRSVLTTIAEGVVVQAADGTITDCNPAAERILGLSRDQLMGRTSVDPRWRAVRKVGSPFPGETHPAMEVLRTGKPQHDVVMGLHLPDGTERWIAINAAPLFRGGDARPHAAVSTFVDITERKRLERRLHACEARLAELSPRSGPAAPAP